MAQLTITQAIKHSPIGRTRMYSHYIKNGLITVSVDSKGEKYIDSSELLRVFGSIKLPEQGEQLGGMSSLNKAGQSKLTSTEQGELTEQIKLLREQVTELKADKAFLQSQVINLTNRLPPPNEKKTNAIVHWWRGLD